MRVRRMVASGFLAVVLAGSAWVRADDAPKLELSHSGDRAEAWFLVRLKEPLLRRTADGSLALTTGRGELDTAVEELGIERIEPVLRASTTQTRRPAALARRGLDRLYRFHVPPGTSIRQAVARFSALADVAYAEPDYVFHVQSAITPNDIFFPQQWGYHQSSDADVDGPDAWGITLGTAPIAILDTGVDAAHPDLASKVVAGYDIVNDDSFPADDFGHGTQVASVAGARTNNGQGMAGACWGCPIIPLKTLDEFGDSTASWLIDSLVWATDHGAEVVNYSAGNNEHSMAVLDAIRYARDSGVVMVCASGNEGIVIVLPARYAETIAASASDSLDQSASFSSVGREIDHVAPGASIITAGVGGVYFVSNGTSLSAPLVAGLAGMIKTVQPKVGREELRDLINFGAEDEVGPVAQDTPGWDPVHGWGRVNMHRSVLGAQAVATLRVTGSASTRLYYEVPNAVATSYDFIRGDLENLTFGFLDVELGDVVCLENNSPDTHTLGHEDNRIPAPGQGFFYLGRFNSGPWPGSFGGSSEGVDRVVAHETTSANLRIDGGISAGELGESVGPAGDVNGDGYDDVIAGAWSGLTPLGGRGSAYLYLGSANGLSPTPAWVLHSAVDGSRLGLSVATAGNVNGDAYDDVIVGEPLWHGPNECNFQGRALVFLGSAGGLPATPSFALQGSVCNAWFGSSVGTAGDVNNDGFDDVIIGSSRHANGQTQEGAAYLFRGSATGVLTSPSWIFESNQAMARLSPVSTAGDVNNDGFDDVLVGAPLYDSVQADRGRVWVFLGSAAGLAATAATTLDGTAGAQLGDSVAAASDLNHDGRDDVFIGALMHSGGESGEGAAFLHLGTASGIATSSAWSFQTNQHWALVSDVGTVGDVNGDGQMDVMVGSRGFRFDRRDEGKAWLFSGTAAGPQASPGWSEIGRQTDAQFGMQVVAAGDLNGDDYDDVIVSADEHETVFYNTGRLHVYYGSPAGLALPDSIWACDVQSP